ncbi:MAG: RNA methyltransferase [Actinomycetota bacterium]|jgi:TrmH family RNA methyltransferase|nr:RNA methyltransferase [Actinomycetota bacterium]
MPQVQMTEREIARHFVHAFADPGRVVLEGVHPTIHALRFGAQLELAVTSDPKRLFTIVTRLAADVRTDIEQVMFEVSPSSFRRLTPRSLSSPLMATTARPVQCLDVLSVPDGKPVVFLEGPRNPGNVGAVIRVAAAADVSGVFVSGRVDPWSPVTIRSATGLQFAVPVGTAELPDGGDRPIVVLDTRGEPFGTCPLEPSSIVVVGGERYGASDRVMAMADRRIALPMKDGVSSLNLSTAVAALLYAWKTTRAVIAGAPPW